MPRVYSELPYSDDYDVNKSYTKILAIPGRTAQAREFNQIQSIFHEYLRRLGDTMLNNGAVVEGCSIIIRDNEVVLSKGKLYMDGLVRDVASDSFTITGVGDELIGIKLQESVVTELGDASLRDPAVGFMNYGQPGANRVKEVLTWTLNDPYSTTVYTITDGAVLNASSNELNSEVTSVLARRTYDESGNYKVRGLTVTSRDQSVGSQVYLNVSEGKAYIEGYEVSKSTSSLVKINYSSEVRQVLNEPKVYTTGVLTYPINNSPVESLIQLKAVVSVTDVMVHSNTPGGSDYLPLTPAVSITSISQGVTTYTNGVDYRLTSDKVDWSLAGIEPVIGSQYSVTWTYNKLLYEGTDFNVITVDGVDYVELTGSVLPVDGTTFDIDYSHYLARKDTISMDSSGRFVVYSGKPDLVRLVESPSVTNEKLLRLASVLVHPNSSKVEVINFNTTRLSMSDLYKLSRRVDDIEYNQAITDLDDEAINNESASLLNGILTDGFIGFTKSDISHSEFDGAIDIDNGEFTLPSVSTIRELVVDSQNSSITINNGLAFAPYTEEVVIGQLVASDAMLVNPYAVYDKMCVVKLEPSVDNWIDTDTVTVNKEEINTQWMRRWWYHKNEPWAESERLLWESSMGTSGHTDDWSNSGLNQSTRTEVSQSVVLDEAIMYMRQRSVLVTGSGFPPSEDNITCLFDSLVVPVTPTGTSVSGTVAGTIKSNAQGKFTASFSVPPNVPCGSKSVRFVGVNGEGISMYVSQGRNKVIQNTVLTTTTVLKLVDPLAQSFGVDVDTMISSVGLYFSTKSNDSPVSVQIRNMVNGYPGPIVHSEFVVDSNDILVSELGTIETKVLLPNPIICAGGEQYSVCILSDSNEYAMFTGTVGSTNLLSDEVVSKQPYSSGVLFSSSNSSTWTAHQNKDLKFKIYKAKFQNNGSLVFNEVSGVSLGRLLLAADSLSPNGTDIEWEYSVGNNPWLPIDSFVERELSVLATQVRVRATLKVTGSLSPIISVNNLNLIGFKDRSVSTYVSRNVSVQEPYSTLRVLVDLSLPAGTSAKLYYSTNGTGTVWTEFTQPTVTVMDEEFSQYAFSATGLEATNYRVKLVLNTNNVMVRPKASRLMNILKY